jgi:hypothetical protein
MQITEKLCNGIALSIPSLTLDEARAIAKDTDVSYESVYRYLREIRAGKLTFRNEKVVLALAKLAMNKKKDASKKHKLTADLEKQLSNIH